MVYTSHQFDLEAIPVYGHQVTAYASDQAAGQAADIVLLPDHVTSTLYGSTPGKTPAGPLNSRTTAYRVWWTERAHERVEMEIFVVGIIVHVYKEFMRHW